MTPKSLKSAKKCEKKHVQKYHSFWHPFLSIFFKFWLQKDSKFISTFDAFSKRSILQKLVFRLDGSDKFKVHNLQKTTKNQWKTTRKKQRRNKLAKIEIFTNFDPQKPPQIDPKAQKIAKFRVRRWCQKNKKNYLPASTHPTPQVKPKEHP